MKRRREGKIREEEKEGEEKKRRKDKRRRGEKKGYIQSSRYRLKENLSSVPLSCLSCFRSATR